MKEIFEDDDWYRERQTASSCVQLCTVKELSRNL